MMTIPLLSSRWIIFKSRKYDMHVVSSVFVLIFSDFNTFHVQGKIEMVYRIFAIMTFPCYLILGNKILECA